VFYILLLNCDSITNYKTGIYVKENFNESTGRIYQILKCVHIRFAHLFQLGTTFDNNTFRIVPMVKTVQNNFVAH
jgi:hypothetical protein